MLSLPTCKQVCEQLSENIDETISGPKKFKLKLHLLMCRLCRRYDHQLQLSVKTINLLEKSYHPNHSVKQRALQQYQTFHEDKHGKKS